MSINTQSLARRTLSVSQQKPDPYFQLSDDYPGYVFTQRVQAVNPTPTKLNFSLKSVDPNLFLRSKAYLKLSVSMQNDELDNALTPVLDTPISVDSVIYKKPGMLIANSATEMNLKLNNFGINLKEQRYWQKYLTAQHAGKTITEKYLSTSGSRYPQWTGLTDVNTGYPSETVQFVRLLDDKGIDESSEAAFIDITSAPGAQTTFNYSEPVNIGCFNFLDDKKKEIYDKSWYKNMSSLIPYIKQVALDISLNDLAANTLIYLYSRRVIGIAPQPRASRLTAVSIVSAELVVEWVRPRTEMLLSLPPSIDIQSFFIDHREFVMNNGDDIAYQTNSTIDIQNLIIHQVPSYMIFYATVNKDSPNYECVSISSSRDIGGVDLLVTSDLDSAETNLQLVDNTFALRLNSMGGDSVIDTRYSNRELYEITLKNSIKDAPWNHRQWTGGEGRLALYPPNTYVILGEEDLLSYFVRKGQTVDNLVLNFSATYRNEEGHGVRKTEISVGGDKPYNFHISLIYDRYFIRISNCGTVEGRFDSKFI